MEGIFMIIALFFALTSVYAETTFPERGRVKKSFDSIENEFNKFQIKHNKQMKPTAQSRVDKTLSLSTKLMLEEEMDHKIRELKKGISASRTSSNNFKPAWSPENESGKRIHDHDGNPKFPRQIEEKLEDPEPGVATKPENT